MFTITKTLNTALISVASLALLTACGSESSSEPEEISEKTGYPICSNNDKKALLWEYLQRVYLWNDSLPANINLQDYPNTSALMEAVRKSPEDIYSVTRAGQTRVTTRNQETTIPHTEIIEYQGLNVAYMAYTGFLPEQEQQLISALDDLAEQEPDAMILDLRENSGGWGFLGKHIGASINSNLTGMELFYHTTNATITPQVLVEVGDLFDSPTTLEQATADLDAFRAPVLIDDSALEFSMDLDQLIVLTSETTCSASELLINGLEPFIDVVLVGEKTCGKPLSSFSQTVCEGTGAEETFSPIVGLIHNADGVTDYYDGLPVDCSVSPTRADGWANTQDPSVATGLFYAVNGSCN